MSDSVGFPRVTLREGWVGWVGVFKVAFSIHSNSLLYSHSDIHYCDEPNYVIILIGAKAALSPRSGGGTRRLIRRGEPTGLIPRGSGAEGGLGAAYILSYHLLRPH